MIMINSLQTLLERLKMNKAASELEICFGDSSLAATGAGRES
jgi:hypothetical protein